MPAAARRTLLTHVLAPIASEEDGRQTARAIEPYGLERVTMVFVIKKAGGGPDPASPAQATEHAEASFAAFREVLPQAEDHIAYGTDVAETIFEAATELGASAIGFTTHGGSLLMQILAGDTARNLITNNEIPVISFPRPADRER